MMMRRYKAMKSLGYHEKQLDYNIKGLLNEVRLKKNIPEGVLIDLNDPEFKDILKNSPFNPKAIGGLAQTFGISDKVITVELWRDLSNGWLPASYLPEGSKLKVVETGRGPMVKLNRSAVPIREDGAYDYKSMSKDKDQKTRRPGTEFLYVFGDNLSTVIANMATKDPQVEVKFNEMCMKVFQQHIMPELLADARLRKGKDGKEIHRVEEILAVPFLHSENRAGAPFYHFHFDLMNVAKGYSGQLYTLSTDLIGENASKYDAIFMSRMKDALEKEFGFTFEKVFHKDDVADDFQQSTDKKVVSFDIPDAAIPEAVREFRSARQKEIDEELKKLKKQGHTAKEIARLESRDEKTDLSPSQLRDQWAKEFSRLGWTQEQMLQDLEKVKVSKVAEPAPDDLTIEKSLLRHTKEVDFTEDQFKAHAIKQLIGHMPLEKAEREAERIFKNECVLIMDKEKMNYFKPFLEGQITDPVEYQTYQMKYGKEVRFTTHRILEMDRYVVESTKARELEEGFKLDKNEIHKAILAFESAKGFTLAPGQKDAILAATTQPGAVVSIQGRAGAGKSTLARVIKEQYEAKGFEVWGTSTSSSATKVLAKDTGLDDKHALNAAKLLQDLDKGKVKLTAKSVVLVDEAGMMDTETYYRLIKHSNEAGAKLVLSGESEQLAAVGFGGHLKTLSDRFHTARVTDINRQKEQAEREMVEDFASGRSHKAIKYLHDQGRVVITDTTKERVAKLVDDYFTSKHKTEDKIVVAATNEDVDNLNDAIRERLKAQGTIGQSGVNIKGKDGYEREFSLGDRVIFTKKAKSEDLEEATLNNSDIGEVKEFRKGARGTITSMKLKMGDGKEVWISTSKEQPLKHAYAVTIHKSQGQTKAQSFYFVSSNLNSLNQAYVACSRHKETVTMYLSKDQVDIMSQKMEERAPTAKMLEVAGYVAKNMGVQIPEEATHSFNACREFLNQKYEKITTSPRHAIDDFINIVESMSQAQFKKTTFDFEVLDGKHRNTYEAIKLEEARVREQERLRQQKTQKQGIAI